VWPPTGAEWLRAGEDAALVETIRASTRTGRAAGGEAFLARIEKLLARTRRAKKRKQTPKARRKAGRKAKK